MQENEFEKQIQGKLDELRLNPSSAIWENIESKMKKEKRRRRGVILFPAALVCFFLICYLLWNSGIFINNNKQDKFSKEDITKKNISRKAQTSLTPETETGIQIKDQNSSAPSASKKGSNDLNIILQNLSKVHLNKSSQIHLTEKQKMNSKVRNSDAFGITQNGLPDDSYEKIYGESNEKIQLAGIPNKIEFIADSFSYKITNVKIKPADEFTPESKKLITAKVSKKDNRVRWGFTLSGGISGVTNKFLSSADKNFMADAQFNNNGGISGGSPVAQPSKIKSAGALNAGIFIERSLSRILILRSGINYKFYSTKNSGGIDSVNFQARSLITNKHNYYHFVDLPVELQVSVNSIKNLPLHINTGIFISRYIGSNALQFNSASGLYYRGNLFFNRTQVGFNTGLSATLFSKQKTSLRIGPYIYYGLTKIANEGLYKNKHFTSVELRTQIMFGKK